MEVGWLEQSAAEVPAENDWLSASEQALLSPMRIPKRRSDWRLGRWTAKHAVAVRLDLPPDRPTLAKIEIRPAQSGAPEAFLAGEPADVSISLSHRAGIGACAIAPAGSIIGCDLELVEPRSEAFVADYLTSEEQALVRQSSETDRPAVIALVWSAKESALKALRSGLRLDTRSVAVTLDGLFPNVDSTHPSSSTPISLAQDWRRFRVQHEQQVFHGWWQNTGDLVRTLVAVPALPPPIFLAAPRRAFAPITRPLTGSSRIL